MRTVKTFLKKFKREINKVQKYEGEVYSPELKEAVAKLIKHGISRYQIAKETGLHYTLVRNYDLEFNGRKRSYKKAA